MSFTDKPAFITRATRGIGWSIASRFARQACKRKAGRMPDLLATADFPAQAACRDRDMVHPARRDLLRNAFPD